MTWGVPLSVSYHFAFSYCSWGSQGKNTEVVCHSLLQWTTFYLTSPPWPGHLGWPHMTWLIFIELDKAVVHVIRLACCLWLWFLSVALWCPLATPTVFLGFLLPWTWGISPWLLQQSTATTPYLVSTVFTLNLWLLVCIGLQRTQDWLCLAVRATPSWDGILQLTALLESSIWSSAKNTI